MEQSRCQWCNLKNPLYVKYHDEDWGVPAYDDQTLFEFLILEPFQAGLAWETILSKRENFREAFDHYDLDKICNYNEDKICELLQNPGIIRNRRKIEAAIHNARIFRNIQNEWSSFSDYIWHFSDHKIIYEVNQTTSPLSDTISKDLKKRGMKFIGSTIIYAYLQAIGIIYSHDRACFMFKEGEENLC